MIVFDSKSVDFFFLKSFSIWSFCGIGRHSGEGVNVLI